MNVPADHQQPYWTVALQKLLMGVGAGVVLIGGGLVVAHMVGIVDFNQNQNASPVQTAEQQQRAAAKARLEQAWKEVEQLDIADREVSSLRWDATLAPALGTISRALNETSAGQSADINRLRDSLGQIRIALQKIEDARSASAEAHREVKDAETRQKEISEASFRVGRRFDTEIATDRGMYEATRGYTKVVLIAPEEKVGDQIARAMNGVKLPVRSRGEEPYITQAGTREYAVTYVYEPKGKPTDEELAELRAEAVSADHKLDRVRRNWATELSRNKP